MAKVEVDCSASSALILVGRLTGFMAVLENVDYDVR